MKMADWRSRLERLAPRGINDIDDRGWTLLHVYASIGDLKGVRRLLKEEGMDANITAWGPKSRGITPLHLAAKGGHLRVMEALLDHGADIDARTEGFCGWTPLHYAAKEREKPAIRFLLENGAFLPKNINDQRFNPPLYYCVGLDFAYEEAKRIQPQCSSSSSSSSEPSSSTSQKISQSITESSDD